MFWFFKRKRKTIKSVRVKDIEVNGDRMTSEIEVVLVDGSKYRVNVEGWMRKIRD